MEGLTPHVSIGRGTRLPTIGGYLWLVRSFAPAIAIMAGFGLMCGLYLAKQVPQEFKASASIELPDVPTWVDTLPDPPGPQRTTIDTTGQLVFSTPVFDAVSAATGLGTQTVADGLSISAYPLSRVLIVSFQAKNPNVAMVGAQAAAVELQIQRAEIVAGAQTDKAVELVRDLEALKLKAQGIRQFSPLTKLITNHLLQVRDAIQAGGNAGGTIVSDADDFKRVKKHPELQIMSGLIIGLMGGVFYAWWRRGRHLHNDPRIIGLAAKVRPRWRSGRRSPPRAPEPRGSRPPARAGS